MIFLAWAWPSAGPPTPGLAHVPLNRFHHVPGRPRSLRAERATPDDVTAALRYLIDARAVTGQMIAVDSGQHLGWLTPDIIHP